MLKVGLVGAGTMGHTHAASWPGVEGAQLVLVADRDHERAASLAAKIPAAKPCAWQELLESEVDIVDICLPTALHARFTCQAAAAGKHVFCEKPMALNLEQAQEMMAACNASGVQLMIGQVLRFFPQYRLAREQVLAGAVGQPAVARLSRVSKFPGGAAAWYADQQQSGGLVLDLLLHDLDWLRWTFGPVRRVFGQSVSRRRSAGDERDLDYVLLTLQHRSGVLAHLEGSWARPSGFGYSFEIAGREGLIQFDSEGQPPLLAETLGESAAAGGAVVPESPLARSPYELELQEFVASIEEGRPPAVPAAGARASLALALKAREAACGELVELEEELT